MSTKELIREDVVEIQRPSTAVGFPGAAQTAGTSRRSIFSGSLIATSITLILSDIFSIYLGIACGWMAVNLFTGVNIFLNDRLFLFLPYVLLMSLVGHGTYPLSGVNPAYEFRSVVRSLTQAFLLVGVFCFAHYGNGLFMATAVVFLVGIPSAILTSCMRRVTRKYFSQSDWWGIPIVFVGNGKQLQWMYTKLSSEPWLGYRPIGYFGSPGSQVDGTAGLMAEKYLGTSDELFNAKWNVGAHVAMVDNVDDSTRLDDLLRRFSSVFSPLFQSQHHGLWTESFELAGVPCQSVQSHLDTPWHQFIKRTFDVCVSSIALAVLLPFIAAVSLFISFVSPGTPFFRQQRVGKDGEIFWAWKFRTMVPDAESVLERHLETDDALRVEWDATKKLKNDPRVIPMGRLMRKSSFDEVPQLWNVLRGQMSLVGPRPVPHYELEQYMEVSSGAFSLYKRVRPGLTGLWQISGRNHTTYEERVDYDRYYIRNWSIWLDLYILIRTFKTVLLREGAY